MITFALLFLIGCLPKGKNSSPTEKEAKEIGEYYAEYVLYGQNEEKSREFFYDFPMLEERLASTDLYAEYPVYYLDVPKEEIDDEEEFLLTPRQKEVKKAILSQFHEKTSCKVIDVNLTGQTAKITYEIVGLDTIQVFQNAEEDFLKEIDVSKKYSVEFDTYEIWYEVLEKQLKQIPISSAKTISLKFIHENGKWRIPKTKSDDEFRFQALHGVNTWEYNDLLDEIVGQSSQQLEENQTETVGL